MNEIEHLRPRRVFVTLPKFHKFKKWPGLGYREAKFYDSVKFIGGAIGIMGFVFGSHGAILVCFTHTWLDTFKDNILFRSN